MRRKLVRIALALLVLLAVSLLSAGLWLRSQFMGSLPQTTGEIATDGVKAPVTVERDSLGIPTIKAQSRVDLAFATGFVHAQDRFFQMDLLRRNSAGELSELVGKAALPLDRRTRAHRFRTRAKRVFEKAADEDKAIVESYTRGVNAGLKSLGKLPFEYQLMRLDPKPWQNEDGVLVQFSMFLDLQLDLLTTELAMGILHDTVPEPLFGFLAPRGTEWDAPLDGTKLPEPPIPGPEVLDLRKRPTTESHAGSSNGNSAEFPESVHVGSNNWAVAGKRTKTGAAIVCNDMHLRFSAPNIWYRASYEWKDDKAEGHKATGVTLPGTPAIIVGCNGKIAWGFTNSEADWSDLVVVETDAADADKYRTPEGLKAIETVVEEIAIKDGGSAKLEIRETLWGPILGKDAKGRPLAHRWVAHDVDGVNLNFAHMEAAQSLNEALELANRSGIPGQNFTIGEHTGRIAWTIAGRLPKRFGHEGRLPVSWADGKSGWNGYREPAEYPRIIDPPSGQIWTANARVVGGEFLDKLGFGNYDLGARSKQIRDDLTALEKVTEADMLKVHLDDKAVFLSRWQKLLLATLTSEAVSSQARRAEIKRFAENWGERATVESVGFRLVREFRFRVADRVLRPLTQPCTKAEPNFHYGRVGQTEGPLWRLVSERPAHLLEAKYKNWDDLLLQAVDDVAKNAYAKRETLDGYTHGESNRFVGQHPLGSAVPSLGTLLNLDMPNDPLPGDSAHMPRVQSPTHGASERMAVSPGHEADGYLHMPTGQSGHPASPHYRDMHSAWAKGEPAAFLPGTAVAVLRLNPK